MGTSDREGVLSEQSHRARIAFLDGLRGIAILLVLLFHAYARWPEIVPYGSRFQTVPLFAYGYIGVQLFFLISGFVICMTLEKCRNYQDFLLRRWLRLFPAMLVISVSIFVSAPLFFPHRPAGPPSIQGAIPGLLLLDPEIIRLFIKGDWVLIEGAFWSIFVEVGFYFVFGALFFLLGAWRAIWVLFAFFLIRRYVIGSLIALVGDGGFIAICKTAMDIVGVRHFAWFASGALFYEAYKAPRFRVAALASAVGVLACFASPGIHGAARVACLIILICFAAPVVFPSARGWLSGRVLRFFGFISYPLYLVHENAMVSLIVSTGNAFPAMPGILIPVVPILVVVLVAWLVARYGESLVRSLLNRPYQRFCRFVGAQKLQEVAVRDGPLG